MRLGVSPRDAQARRKPEGHGGARERVRDVLSTDFHSALCDSVVSRLDCITFYPATAHAHQDPDHLTPKNTGREEPSTNAETPPLPPRRRSCHAHAPRSTSAEPPLVLACCFSPYPLRP